MIFARALFDVSLSDWAIILTAVATLVAAVAALVTAFVTRSTVREMRAAREEAQKPSLVFDHERPDANRQPAPFEVKVKNIGGGPALRCRYFCFSPQWPAKPKEHERYLRADTFSLGAHDAVTGKYEARPVESWRVELAKAAVVVPDYNERPIEVLLCEDSLGNRYRFARLRRVEHVPAKERHRHAWASGWPGDNNSKLL